MLKPLSPLEPLADRLRVFLVRGTLVGVTFFGIYPLSNWITSHRAEPRALFLTAELQLPLVPAFIWVYLSMYALFVLPPFFLGIGQLKRLANELIGATIAAGLIFLLVPARLGFPRVVPDSPTYQQLFTTLFSIDKPFNLVPSLHVVYSTIICASLAERASLWTKALLYSWLILLLSSTVLVHQHQVLDVATGAALAILARYLSERSHA